MAPKQFSGARVTTATDIFAWASLVAYAATERYPFGSDGTVSVAQRIIHDRPDHRRRPAPLGDLVRAAFAKEPHHRPTAAHLYSAFVPQRQDRTRRDDEYAYTNTRTDALLGVGGFPTETMSIGAR